MTDEIAIGHLQRRKIEARVLIPFIAACREKFGDGPTSEVVAATIRAQAAEEGAKWAGRFGSDVAGLRALAETVWAGGGGLDLEVLDQTGDRLAFDVTRCRYAEFYKELGLADLGSLIHCSRDHAMVAGFNDDLELARSQTIMQGGSCCDFRFRRKTR
jgi:L-2-amino-thiazoline-4-carboxylic acid hydrolase-like protein